MDEDVAEAGVQDEREDRRVDIAHDGGPDKVALQGVGG